MHADQARGIVVVIDVFRAFSVAAYALAGGARGLWLVRRVEEAWALRELEPEALLVGEVGGRLIADFDHNNSPSRMASADVRGKLLIQRTGAGTQAAVNATGARHLLVCSLVNARATAEHARRLAVATGEPVTLVPTEVAPAEDGGALEDDICADYLEALLRGQPGARDALTAVEERLRAAGRLRVVDAGDPDFPLADVGACLDVDRFRFAMVGRRQQWSAITSIQVARVDAPAAGG